MKKLLMLTAFLLSLNGIAQKSGDTLAHPHYFGELNGFVGQGSGNAFAGGAVNFGYNKLLAGCHYYHIFESEPFIAAPLGYTFYRRESLTTRFFVGPSWHKHRAVLSTGFPVVLGPYRWDTYGVFTRLEVSFLNKKQFAGIGVALILDFNEIQNFTGVALNLKIGTRQ